MNHAGVWRDVLGWDSLNWQRALACWELYLPRRLHGWQALELGAAGGGLSLYLGIKGAQVICTNLKLPGPQTQALHQQYGLKFQYQAVDARQLPFADASLELVCFKSVLGGIRKGQSQDPKPVVLAEIQRVLKPGGWLLFAENLRGHVLHTLLRRHFVTWSPGWEYLTAADWCQLLGDFAEVHTQSLGLTALLGRNEAQRRALGYLDRLLDPHVPPDWHYILSVAARKSDQE